MPRLLLLHSRFRARTIGWSFTVSQIRERRFDQYLEAYCRANSTDADWEAHDDPATNEFISLSNDKTE